MLSRLFAIVMVLAILLLPAGCGSGGGNGGDSEVADNTPPLVSILEPTVKSTYATETTPITVSGTAADDSGIERVDWRVGDGPGGKADGTVSWTAVIDLSPGENRITVTATDLAGNKDSAVLAVTYTEQEYSLGGTVSAAANTAIDSDVNDPNAPYTPNDTAGQAQALHAPVTLGGYVNQPETGSPGRSYEKGDAGDVFRADLLAGETIVLAIAEPFRPAASGPDLDLYLYDAASLELLDASVDLAARVESLSVPGAGTYLVQVTAAQGASNYTLTVGRVGEAENRAGLRLHQSFVPGETIAEFVKPDGLRANAAEPALPAGLRHKAGRAGMPRLFSFSPERPESAPESVLQSGSPPRETGDHKAVLLAGAWMDSYTREKLVTLHRIKDLRKRADVVFAEPNYLRRALQAPSDPYYPLQWHYPLIHLAEAWDVTRGSSSVAVAVVDSGILSAHPDLSGKITGSGYDFISDAGRAMDGDGIDENPEDPGDGSIGGSLFHGTHVAGIIAAATDNKTGVSGVGWNARIMAIRALGRDGTGTSYDILQAVRYAAGLENDSGTTPENLADIINLSFGGEGFSLAEQDVYRLARQAGTILVASAGNSARDTPFYPAAYDGVTGVSAVDINAGLAPYSNFGPWIDAAAPGGDFSTDLNGDGYVDGILSTCGDDASGTIENVYTFQQGTSMAAPHVSGVAALMKAVRPALTPGEFDRLLQSGAIVRDIGAPGRDDMYGHGLIDAHKAVLAARDGSVPTILNVSPVRLNFGVAAETAVLTASRSGPDPLRITGVSSDAAWLSVAPSDTDENGLGTYTAAVSREGLPEGVYDAEITFVSSENTVQVPVGMRVRTAGLEPDAGYHYILLVDDNTDTSAGQVAARAENGLYEYGFSGIPPGNYRVYAGTDSDNDGLIGDPGEAAGAYRSLDQPEVLTVDSDRAGLDFVTEFRVYLSQEAAPVSAKTIARLEKKPEKRLFTRSN